MKQNVMVTNSLQSEIGCLEYAARIDESLILNTLCVLHWKKKNNVGTNCVGCEISPNFCF